MPLEGVDLSQHTNTPECEMDCGRKAMVIAKGCMDSQPVLLCDQCLDRGLEAIKTYVHYWQRLNKKVMICGDCHRPVLRLDTHLDVRHLK